MTTGTLKEIMMQIPQLKSTWNYIIWQAVSRTINCKNLIKLFNYYTLILIYLRTNLSPILNLFVTSFSKCWKIVTLQFYCDVENLYLYSSLKILEIFLRCDPGCILFILEFTLFNMQKIYLTNTENLIKRIVLLPNLLHFKSRK